MTITEEQISNAILAAGLTQTDEVFSLLGQPVHSWGRDDEQTWHLVDQAMKVTGHWDGLPETYYKSLDVFYRHAGLYACECPCDCWNDECTDSGCPCDGCSGPAFRDVKLLTLPGTFTLRLVPWMAVFKAMHFGPWASEFFKALQESGLMDKLLVAMIGDAPAPVLIDDDGNAEQAPYASTRDYLERNGPIVVDAEPLIGSPIAFLEGPNE